MNKPIISIAALIPNCNNEVFLIQRKNPLGHLKWASPGGHLECGETVTNAVFRECYEEVGINVKKLSYLTYTDDFFTNDNYHYVTMWFLCTEYEGIPYLKEKREIILCDWFSYDKFRNISHNNLFLPFINLLNQGFFVDGFNFPKILNKE